MKKVKQLLDYMATNLNAKIGYQASNMILNLDILHLTAAGARSRAGGYFSLGSLPKDGVTIELNRNILITCSILKLVAASAAEALGALFLNAQEAKVIN